MHMNVIDSYFGEVIICFNKAEHNQLGTLGTALWRIDYTTSIFKYSIMLRSALFYKLAVT